MVQETSYRPSMYRLMGTDTTLWGPTKGLGTHMPSLYKLMGTQGPGTETPHGVQTRALRHTDQIYTG